MRLVGTDKAKELARAAHLLQRRIPLGNAWVAACLHHQGPNHDQSITAIARKPRITDVTVRRYLDRYGVRKGAR